ncbi:MULTISPECIES: hypothetical protein [unclassified Phyllobacterium]|uniref:hypothetical protein n=1 Tax=unclassified Phyllobacterium TaxID=2638441 RepID=UPI00301313EC
MGIAAQAAISKGVPLYVQNETDATIIRSQGFSNVRVLSEKSELAGIRLIKISGRHSTDAAYDVIGGVPETFLVLY